jgi:cell division protein FtsB
MAAKINGKNHKKNNDFGSMNLIMQIVFVFITLLMFYNIGKSLVQTNSKYEILKQAEEEVAEQRLENIRTVMEADRVYDPEFTEEEARNRLNYGRDGEIQLVISEQLINDAKKGLKYTEYTEEVGEVYLTDSSNIEAWIQFFIKGI